MSAGFFLFSLYCELCMFESVSKGGCKWPIRPSCTVTLIKSYLCIDVKDEAAFLNFKYAAGFDAYVAYSAAASVSD